MRIVRLANFVTVHTGGLRTALRQLGRGYQAAGHEAVLVIPGRRYSDKMTKQGRVITLPSAPLPRTGGYRVLAGRRELVKLLDSLEPDRIEVSDRTTLRWTGNWARQRGVRSMMVSHESLAGLLGVWGMPKRDALADRFNRRTAEAFDTIVCTTSFAAAEFRRLDVPNLVEVPLGVDLKLFHPSRMDVAVRSRYARPDELLMVYCSRLSAAKRPELAVDTVASLRNGKVPAVLVMAGDGTRRTALAYRAARLPVRFAGHISDRSAVAALLASADVALSPGPVETFGLAALEAMACGTPVVVNEQSALPEVVGGGGIAAAGTAEAFADAVSRLMERPRVERRGAAREQAEQYGWPKAVAGFLQAHEAVPAPAPAPALIRPAVPARPYLPSPRRTTPVREAGADEAGAARYA
ncbi:alpha-1,6-mannosyltransferase [Actinoplanes campanulatus]|uniref:Alpha-1,6-mannosyltransferase n=1 Tax=Actinoplanes campanulatus TaxID=113559 RepID=A0A7W5AM46_9ACTN|nr:glycosyltransferase [Actinoplanes campanulatus]MBB3098807.1 alpha-1,6-mannosyltransferase [Actinoplanes campanulatus]GGN36958.1 GDP-mannose-dependent alpha-(1-6)-phosphatidylinositol dimannoside mannosyltransferase [Actinoplanes campanulatus]GID40690.1 GDP-mannose-dependent alpha-(1-6)-phosphatidylinositol dimannoside mannosyltransferase [Actinoplanes campanulatus]